MNDSCFAIDKEKCTILTDMICRNRVCPFYKPRKIYKLEMKIFRYEKEIEKLKKEIEDYENTL